MTRRTKVLQTLMTIRADGIVRFYGIPAIRALTILHELTLLERHFELLLITVDAQKRWTQQAIRD